MDISLAFYILGGLLLLVGIVGIVLPALPGVPLMFAGMLMVAWAGNFSLLGPGMLVVLGVLTLLSVFLDLLAGLIGAQRVGASRLALIGAAIGTVVGLFFGLIGVVLGPFIGAFLGELAYSRKSTLATRVGIGTWIGLLLGTIAKIGIAFLMLGVFVLALLL
ncbi:MAG: DUF456 domain-containing protein [Lysobacteraceae bacterium]|jgi:uncharacterized protein YqgC (DUF456 family)|uniref:DUF456 domain-containing protein n=1 Tax=Denitratimonas sp. CY0512 TaxID=3131940 RepID=UPI0016B95A90|nr:DUF456 domain-containing protein [Gammaproteobacteria bacterium]